MLIEKLYFNKGERVVSNYFQSSQLNETALIFHEIFTCRAYIRHCLKHKCHIKPFVLVLHTNGEVFKMLRIYFPKFANSRYEARLNNEIEECFNKASNIVFVSKLSKEKFIELYPQYIEKSHLVYNGIAENEINYSPVYDGKLRLVTVGTVNARKNQKMIIECLGEMQISNIELTIVGDGDSLDECKTLCAKYHLEDSIHFLGARKDVELILANSNVFVMSSYDEGLPISAIEAMRAKLPLILTDVGGNRELLKNNGLLIKPNKNDLKSALIQLMKSPDQLILMSENSHQMFIKQFSIDKMILEYCKLFKSLVKNDE